MTDGFVSRMNTGSGALAAVDLQVCGPSFTTPMDANSPGHG
jgi:hypothetical protein